MASAQALPPESSTHAVDARVGLIPLREMQLSGSEHRDIQWVMLFIKEFYILLL